MTTQRRFSCTESGCGKAFFRSEHLSRHRLNHRPKQVFQCANCPKRFVRKDLLQRHEKRHDRGMWFRNSGGVVSTMSPEDDVSTSPGETFDSSQPFGPGAVPPVPFAAADGTDDIAGIKTPGVGGMFQPPPQEGLDMNTAAAQADGMMFTPADAPPPLASPSSSSSWTMEGMTWPGACNSLFLDPSAEVQSLNGGIEWLLEGAGDSLTPMDATMGFKGLPSPSSSFYYPASAPYDSTQPSQGMPPPPNIPTNPGFPLATPANSGGTNPTPSTNANANANPMPPAPPTPWETVRSRLLPALRSLPPDTLNTSFFNPSNLAEFYENYFSNYDSHFPILHRPTLHPTEAPPLLITAIVTLGATLSPDENHFRVATEIHDWLRWIVLGTGSFEPPAPLWCLQTVLILQAQEKMFSTRKHHEMAHIFHGSVITLMKRGAAYSSVSSQTEHPCTELEQSWLRWVSNEASKRTAFFAFLMDAQHTFLFGHTCVLSVHDVQLNLPCSDALWQQQTPQDWSRLMSQTPEPPSFLHTLKGLLAKKPVPSTCSSYSRLVLLHGLLSVTAHFHARDLAILEAARSALTSDDAATNNNSNKNNANANATATATPPSSFMSPPHGAEMWKDVVEGAIETWSFSLLSPDPALSFQAARTLHHMAHVGIHANIIDFHIVAGAPPLLGSKHSRNECNQAKMRVRAWSKKPEAKKVLYHCLRLVQDTVFTGQLYRAAEDNIAPRPWCLYHATLVLWAYGYIVEESNASKKVKQQKRGRRVVASQSTPLGSRVDPTMMTTGSRPEVQPGRKDSVAFGAEEYVVRMLMLLESGGSAKNNRASNTKPDRYDEKDIGPNSIVGASVSSGPSASKMLERANETRDLILFVRECLANCRWELLQEGYDTLGRLVGISPPNRWATATDPTYPIATNTTMATGGAAAAVTTANVTVPVAEPVAGSVSGPMLGSGLESATMGTWR